MIINLDLFNSFKKNVNCQSTLRQTDISCLCKEFGINLILHDIDDSRKEKNRLIRNEKGTTKYKYRDGKDAKRREQGSYKAIERKVGNKNLGDEESLIIQ